MEKARQHSALTWAALMIVAAGPARAEEPIGVPSGQEVTFLEMVGGAPGPDGLTARFRFLAPGIAGNVDFDMASTDMAWLCQNYALPRIAGTGPQPAQIVISLSDRPVAFGESDPDVIQFFEAYRPLPDGCEQEAF